MARGPTRDQQIEVNDRPSGFGEKSSQVEDERQLAPARSSETEPHPHQPDQRDETPEPS